jgi:hypothetical protein
LAAAAGAIDVTPEGGPVPQSATDPAVERFRPTSGRLSGVLALLLAAAILGIAVVDPEDGFSAPLTAVALLVAVLAWSAMLRPALWVTEHHLVMRNMLETVHIPLAAIEELAVRQVLAVRVGDRRYVSSVVGRPLRKVLRHRPRVVDPAKPPTEVAYPDFVEDRVRELADRARDRAGVRRGSDEQLAIAADVRREPAWVPIGLIAVSLVGVVLTLAL